MFDAVLGAATRGAWRLRFGLRGRVDLYQAFWVAATESLRLGGVIGIVPNRFLSTIADRAYAGFSRNNSRWKVDPVTKLFEAAVLPAVLSDAGSK